MSSASGRSTRSPAASAATSRPATATTTPAWPTSSPTPTPSSPATRSARGSGPSTGSTPTTASLPTSAATTAARTTATRSSGSRARTTAWPTPSTPPAPSPPALVGGRSGSAPNANDEYEQGALHGSGQPHHHRRQPGRGPRGPLHQQRHRRDQPAGGRHPAGPAGRPVARRRDQLLQGQRLARPGREPGRVPGQGGPSHGHRAAPPAQLGDPRGRQAVGHRAGGRRGRRQPEVGHGQG